MIRVVVAEDSLTVRELLVAILESDPGIEVVGEAKDGAEAVELVERLRPDIVTMDIEMPLMDGLTATKEIMVRRPTPIVVVSASESDPHVQRSFDAIRAGALMLLDKPENPASPLFNGRKERFLDMVKAMSDVRVVHRWDRRAGAPARQPRAPAPADGIRLVVVAGSAGGPSALRTMLRALPRAFPVPVLVVQHIARGFAAGLAGWLGAGCDLHVKLAEDGEAALARTVYLGPDDRHLTVDETGRIVLTDDGPVGGHRPAADVLFGSVAATYGASALGVILTGMGRDGAEGARLLKEAGGTVLAQDEASSVVYGMNRAAVLAGHVDEVLAVEQIGPRIAEMVEEGWSDDD